MKKRIKYMYETGNTSLLQIIFSSESMGDFLNKAEFVKNITEYDRNMLDELQIILDLGLPDGDGIEIIKSVREISKIPIIVVSARQEEEEKIQALDLGADDYVTKPFYMGELLARIRVALRKSNQIPEEKKEKIFQCDYLKVDWEKHQVSIDEKEVHLTPMEYKILKLLIDNRGKVLTHNYILSQIWGSAQGVEAANLRVFMAALRRKIEKDPGNCRFILTEVGVGYRFREAVE